MMGSWGVMPLIDIAQSHPQYKYTSTHSHLLPYYYTRNPSCACASCSESASNLKPDVELIPTPSLIAKPDVIIVNKGVIPRVPGGKAPTGTVRSRRWNQAIVRIIDANRRDHAVNRAPWTHGQPSRETNGHSKDVVLGHVLSEKEERPLGPTRQSVRQVLVHFGALLVRRGFDVQVELSEELEGEVCDLEFAEEIPRHEGVEQLFGSVQRRKIMGLERREKARLSAK